MGAKSLFGDSGLSLSPRADGGFLLAISGGDGRVAGSLPCHGRVKNLQGKRGRPG